MRRFTWSSEKRCEIVLFLGIGAACLVVLWDEERVRRVLEHYETQSDEEAVAEDEAAYEATSHTAMDVPVDLVPAVRELIAKRRAG